MQVELTKKDIGNFMPNSTVDDDLYTDNSTYFNESSYAPVSETPTLFPFWVICMWTGVLVILLIVGVCGNGLVVAVVARTKDLRSSTNLLLVNLAGADLLVLLVALPTALLELHSPAEIWLLGEEMCKIVPFVEWTVSHASILTIMVIGSERYYAICRPLRASYTFTRVRAFGCIFVIWIFAFVVSFPIVFLSDFMYVSYKGGFNQVPTCITNISTSWGKIYYTAMIALLFFLPLALLMILYILIGIRLMKEGHTNSFQRNNEHPNVMKARRQVVFMIATVTIVFFVCLLPFRIYSLWIVWDPTNGRLIGQGPYYSILYVTRTLLYLNSSINPILYSLTSSKFREAFLKLIHPDSSLVLSRHSTLTNTGPSNGRSISSRSSTTDPFGTNHIIKEKTLARYSRQWSMDGKRNSQYGRQAMPIATNNNTKKISIPFHNNMDLHIELHEVSSVA